MIDRLLGLPRGKAEGIAIFEMNDPAMPTRQTHSSIRSFGSSGSFAEVNQMTFGSDFARRCVDEGPADLDG